MDTAETKNRTLTDQITAAPPAQEPEDGDQHSTKTSRPLATWCRRRAGDACLRAAAALATALGLAQPATAFASIDVSSTLTSVLTMLSNGIVLLGGILVVMGLVNLGMSLRDTGRSGAELSGALGMIVGGIVVSAAGAYFRTLDTNIAG